MRRAEEAGVSWPVPADWDDERLESALFPRRAPSTVARPEPDWSWVHRELARHKGVPLQLLWLEYKQAHPDGYQYSRFCERYAEWRGRLAVTIRQPYRGGEKAFVDYAGPTVRIVLGRVRLPSHLGTCSAIHSINTGSNRSGLSVALVTRRQFYLPRAERPTMEPH